MKKIILLLLAFSLMLSSAAYSQTSDFNSPKGRTNIIMTSTAYAAGLYGWGIPYLFDADSTRTYVGSEMVSTFGGFALSLVATRNYNHGPVVAKALQSGALVGTLYGLGISMMFAPDKPKAYVGSAMITTPLGAAAGYGLIRKWWVSEGRTELITTGGIIGGLYGLGIPYLINMDDLKDTTQARIYAGSAMIGIPLGSLIFNEISHRTEANKGRTRLIELGACVGAYYGYGFTSLVDPEKGRPYVASMMLCLPIGTGVSVFLTRGEDYGLTRSTMIILGSVFGDLFGRGVAYLAGADTWRESNIGGMAGLPLGVFTATFLTKGYPEEIQQKGIIDMTKIHLMPIFSPSPGLAIVGYM